MEIAKSSRHAKVIGDFGESLMCNWLSRSGFEVVRVDHTGIDLVAYNRSICQRLGITVKSRTRTAGTEEGAVNIFLYRKGKNDRQKVLDACEASACDPWVAVYVEATDHPHLYLTTLQNYDAKYRRAVKVVDAWQMGVKERRKYDLDPEVKHLQVLFKATNWEWRGEPRTPAKRVC